MYPILLKVKLKIMNLKTKVLRMKYNKDIEYQEEY